jgi:hypothetical protein
MSVMFLINALGQYERDTGMSLEDVSVIVVYYESRKRELKI